jgi:hypothetical protein
MEGYTVIGTLQRPWHGSWRIHSDAIIDDYVDAIASSLRRKWGVLAYLDRRSSQEASRRARKAIANILEYHGAKTIFDGEADLLYLPTGLESRLGELSDEIDHLFAACGSKDRFSIAPIRTASGS